MRNKEIKFVKYARYNVDFEYLNQKVDFFLTIPNMEPKKEYFWAIIEFFKDKKIIKPADGSFLNSFSVICEDIEYTIECENLIARQILSILLNLQVQNKPLYSSWYRYDYNSCTETPQFIHSFFLAYDYKIILEDAEISTSWMDECDPNILVETLPAGSSNSSMPLWSNIEADLKATALWYYKKFYKETTIGQILSIREKTVSSSLPKLQSTDSTLPDEISLLSSIDTSLKWLVVAAVIIVVKMFW